MKRSTFFKTIIASVAAFFGYKKAKSFDIASPQELFRNNLLVSSETGLTWPYSPVPREEGKLIIGGDSDTESIARWTDDGFLHIQMKCSDVPMRLVCHNFNDKGELIRKEWIGETYKETNLGSGWQA